MKKRKKGLVLQSLRDFLFLHTPECFFKKTSPKFAFLVHPRGIKDVYRKYPIASKIPKKFLEFILKFYWPVVLSHVTGLKSLRDGKEIDGFVITIPLTARQMIENRSLALKKIIDAVILSKKHGAKIIGLGGLTSSLSKGGLDVLNTVSNINVTTGHAYTSVNVTNNFFKLVEIFKIQKTDLIAIVGAAGSVGSTSAKIIARAGYENLLLIDVERKKGQFEILKKDLLELNKKVNTVFSHQIKDITDADFIITATNAPEALIKSEDLRPGAIILDDAQPSDVAEDVMCRDDVLVIEAGVVHTPNVCSHFNFNLKDKYDNFCCMAEVLILAANEHDDHFVIHRATLEHVDEVQILGEQLGFKVGEFQNYNESIKSDKIERIKQARTS